MNIADLIRSCPVDLTPMLRKSWSPVTQFTDPGLYERLDRFRNDNLPCNIDKNGVLHYASGSNYRIKDWVVMKNYALVTLASQVVQGNTMTGQVYRVHGYFGHSKPPEVEPMKENEGDQMDNNVAVRSSDADAVAFHLISPIALERIAARYQLGSEKYGAFNWTKGFSWGQLLNHSLRHIFHYLAGDRREDHLAGAAWGLITLMHYEHTKTGTDDIYRYVETYDGILVGDSNQSSPRTPTGAN